MQQIMLAFITGLTTGGLSCLAVQGGLVATAVSVQSDANESSLTKKSQITGFFLIAKLFAYALLGFVLGSVGAVLMLSPMTLGLVQVGTGIFLVLTALRIANVHPFFRYFALTPPKWVYKLMRVESKKGSFLSPFILGLFSVLLPCGVTQAMMVVAVASGTGLAGMAIMSAFVLGTSPLFFIVGASIGQLLTKPAFAYIAAVIIALFGVMTINGGLGLRGSSYTLQSFYQAALGDVSKTPTVGANIQNGTQYATITVSSGGYSSSTTSLKAGIPVKLSLVTKNTEGCARAFTIPQFGITKILPKTGNETVEFTPKESGRLAYACSMGMYTGEFDVIP